MSFRLEKKILFQKKNLHLFNNWKINNNVKELHSKRLIKSIYFDNKYYHMMKDSLEGLLPRHKIRIRTYPKSVNKKFYLEKKISSVEGRYKISRIINNAKNLLNVGLHDKKYKKILPVSVVEYTRSYYLYKNIRLTLDQDIYYQNFNNKNRIVKDNIYVLELKTDDLNFDFDRINLDFIFSITRFSKYCRSYNFLNYGFQKAKYETF